MLHIIQQSPFNSNVLQRCLQHTQTGDTVLFIQDGVLAILNPENFMRHSALHFYFLAADVQTRGLQDKVTADVTLIDYDQFVALTIAQHPILTWS